MKPPMPYNPSQNYQKQNPSSSDYGFLKPQFLGSSSAINQSPKMRKDKGFVSLDHEVIVLDDEEDSNTNMDIGRIIHLNFDAKNKGKAVYHHSDSQPKETLGSHSFIPDVEIMTNANKVESSFPSSSQNFIDLDNYDLAEDDSWVFSEDVVDVDKYAALQANFDNMDIPTGIEASIPWFPYGQIGNEVNIETRSSFLEPQVKRGSVNQLKIKEDLASSPNLPSLANHLNLPSETEFLNHVTGSILPLGSTPSYGVDHTNSLHYGKAEHHEPKQHDSLKRRKQHHSNKPSNNQSNKTMLRSETSATSNNIINQTSLHNNMPHSSFPGYMNLTGYLPPMVPVPQMPLLPHMAQEYAKMETKGLLFGSHMVPGTSLYPLAPLLPPAPREVDMPWFHGAAQNTANLARDDSTSATVSPMNLCNFEGFKQFDSVEDHSDHFYNKNGSPLNKPPMKWTKKIQDDWKILEKDLPETIFVRVYESRMDLMRAVIIGAQGTPYHDGLFFFDIFFPNHYPDGPPKVYYHSGGLRLNPNLYHCGKVCLSLLNTWSGQGCEKWAPGVSTILQVLVSIQGLILNSKPFFNEPGYEIQNGSVTGENKSLRYNEDTFLLSIKTMIYSIRRPPKHYEDFVKGHFFKKAHDILGACKAYADGAHVGSVTKDNAQDLYVGKKNSSKPFRNSLNALLGLLVDTLKTIGVSDCEKFMSTQVSPQVSPQVITRSKSKNATSLGITIK